MAPYDILWQTLCSLAGLLERAGSWEQLARDAQDEADDALRRFHEVWDPYGG